MKRRHILSVILICISISPMVWADKDSGQTEFYNFWFPGLSAGVYYFFNTGEFACGGALRYDILYGIETEKETISFTDRGRWEVYIDVGLFSLLPEEGESAIFFFRYVIGFSTSIETPGTLMRNFLIPYIGLEAGGIYFQDRGNGFCLCPLAGINIFSHKQWTLSIDAGLFLSTVAFEEFFGIRPQINFNCVL